MKFLLVLLDRRLEHEDGLLKLILPFVPSFNLCWDSGGVVYWDGSIQWG